MLKIILALSLAVLVSGSSSGCAEINDAMKAVNQACRCYVASPSAPESRWIGCQSAGAPDIKAALDVIPEGTVVDKLWLWKNVIPLLTWVGEKDKNIFVGNVKAKKVIIESSMLGKIQWDALSVLDPTLEVLELRNNEIGTIEDGIFDRLTNLRQLDLSGNLIKKISKNALAGANAEKLELLSLYQNKIFDIEAGSFRGLKNLRRLNLAKNSLTEFQEGVFEGLESLQHLTADDNHLRAIRAEVFSDMKELQRLDVQTNNITEISLRGLSKLEKLYAANNKLTSIDSLKLSNVPNLNNLNLDSNKIGSLTESKTLKELSSLRILSLTHNKITLIMGSALNPLAQLQTLSLQQNQIQDIPDGAFSRLSRLRNLFLQQNSIRRVGENALSGLKSVAVVSLAHNQQLDEVHPDAFKGLVSLSKLFLNDNALQALSNRSLSAIDSLVTLDVADNPWLCDCSLAWMWQWALEGRIDLSNSNTQCGRPRFQLMRKALEDLDKSCVDGVLKAEDNTWITVLGIVLAVLSLLVLGAIVVLYLRDHHSVRRIYALQRVPSDMKLLVREG